MTHEQRAKKMLREWLFQSCGYWGGESDKELDKFFHHLKEMMKKECPND